MFKSFEKRKLIPQMLVCAMAVLSLIGISACGSTHDRADSFLEGKGTQKNPYLIKSVEDGYRFRSIAAQNLKMYTFNRRMIWISAITEIGCPSAHMVWDIISAEYMTDRDTVFGIS